MPGGRDALKYAEETLGVHSAHKSAQDAAHEVERLRNNLALHRRAKAAAEADYADLEFSFISDMRGENPDMSQTAFDKFIKGEINSNPALRKLRGSLADLRFQEETMEAAIRKAQTDCDIAVARLHELGGYLAYLAAIKQASLLPAVWPGVSTT